MQISFDFLNCSYVSSSKLDSDLLSVYNYCTRAFFQSGYSEYRYYDKPSINLWDNLTCQLGPVVDSKIIKTP